MFNNRNRNKNKNGGTFEVYDSIGFDHDELNDELKYFKGSKIDDVRLFIFDWGTYDKITLNEFKKTVYNLYDDNVDSINDEPIKYILRKYASSEMRIMLYYNGKYELIKNNEGMYNEDMSPKIKKCYSIIRTNKFNIIIIHRNKKLKDIDIYLFKNLDDAEKKLKLLDIKRNIEINDERKTKLDRYSMLVTSKYFDTVDDYINVEKSNKYYNGIIDDHHSNPISITDDKQRKTFKNVETYHRYNEKAPDEGIDDELELIFDDEGEALKTIIWRKINPMFFFILS